MLPDFRLETYFSKWEFNARYHMTASDMETLSMQELLDLADDEGRDAPPSAPWLRLAPAVREPHPLQRIRVEGQVFDLRGSDSPVQLLHERGAVAGEGSHVLGAILQDLHAISQRGP